MAAIELNSTPLISDANLNAYWRGESNANDTTANGNNGTGTNISYVAGKFGNSFSFGGNSYITIPDTPSVSITGDMTINFWIYSPNVSSNARGEVFAKWLSAGSKLSFLMYHKASSGYFVFNHSSTGANTLATEFSQTSNPITVNTWCMVTLVVSGTTGKFYVNGSACTDNGQALFSSTYNNDISLYIGARNDGGFASYLQSGEILDDISFFSRALTATEINNLYNGTFTSIKSIGGVAIANVKKVGGVAIASCKKIGGLA